VLAEGTPQGKAELDARFTELYKAHLRDVYSYSYYRVGNHHDAEDLTEQTFLQAYRHFERALREGKVAEKIHHIPMKPGDVIFIPSGRIHAIGAGNVIVEIQQNSDTTYRVYDWNRLGLDGKPRKLQVEESMQSIDFDDIEPSVTKPNGETLVNCEYFEVEKWELPAPRRAFEEGKFAIFTMLGGEVECGGAHFKPGDFFLVPSSQPDPVVKPVNGTATLLRTIIP